MKDPMNTTKTELLEEFDEEFGYLVLAGAGLPYCDVKYIRDRDKRIKQHFSKALDRYRDSVVEEERIKMFKILSDTEETYYDDGYGPFTRIVANVEGIKQLLKQTNNNTTKE